MCGRADAGIGTRTDCWLVSTKPQRKKHSLSAYLGANLLSDLFESLTNSFHRTFTLKDDRVAWTIMHIHDRLGSLTGISQDISDGLLELASWQHLRRRKANALNVFTGHRHNLWACKRDIRR